MSTGADVDGVLVQWGERLFYPGNRIVRSAPTPRLSGSVGQRAATIRQHIRATVIRRAPQVMVKVTGGGRGMAAIAAHFRYISKDGRLQFEDDRGVIREGKEALHDLAEQWRHGGSLIDETTLRREAFNIMLSMPRGTDPLIVERSAREFAKAEFSDHRYVMVLHDHQANPHVHISVRAESRHGKRLWCSATSTSKQVTSSRRCMPRLPSRRLRLRSLIAPRQRSPKLLAAMAPATSSDSTLGNVERLEWGRSPAMSS